MARGDTKTYNQQEQSAFGSASNAAATGAANQAASFGPALTGYQSEYTNPGYSAAEKQAMRQAETGSLAGAFGAAAARERDAAARTGNTAGMNATEEELARQQGQQTAQAQGSLAQAFGNARISGQQNALAGESNLYGQATRATQGGLSAANQDVAQQGAMARTPGFWSSFLRRSGSTLGGGLLGK
ncbi:MAG: hypothetical protein ACRD1Y_13005 [Terriglobales bacterium]